MAHDPCRVPARAMQTNLAYPTRPRLQNAEHIGNPAPQRTNTWCHGTNCWCLVYGGPQPSLAAYFTGGESWTYY
jgi:hypothetical protein